MVSGDITYVGTARCCWGDTSADCECRELCGGPLAGEGVMVSGDMIIIAGEAMLVQVGAGEGALADVDAAAATTGGDICFFTACNAVQSQNPI